MEQKICLDTDICIEIIKEEENMGIKLSEYVSDKVYVSSVSVFELFLRSFNLHEIENFMIDVEILDFDGVIAKKASEIYKDLRKEGKIVDFRDIFIAASCIINNCGLLTLNKKHFERIKGLKVLGI